MPELDTLLLRCPVTRARLKQAKDGASLEAGPRSYPVERYREGWLVDFLSSTDQSAEVLNQRTVYDASDSRYDFQRAQDGAFMQRFVAQFAEGRTKNKERLLGDSLRSLCLTPNQRVLEVGCNDGRYLNAVCALHRCQGYGIDVSRVALRRGLEYRPSLASLQLFLAEAKALPFADGVFDAVISFDVFEHLGHPAAQAALAEIARVLRPGGVAVLYVVSRRDRFTLHETLRTISKGRVGVDCAEGHRYENFITPDELRAYAKAAGLVTHSMQAYHAFWTLFSEEYLANRPPRFFDGLFRLLDWPLTRREYGNGFLIRLGKSQ